MAELNNSNHLKGEQLQYYSTFDGEIVQIHGSSSLDPSNPGSPRISLPPVPVIPGSLSLSDAIVRAGQRREAEILREQEQADLLEDEDSSEDMSLKPAEAREAASHPGGDPLMIAVSPGHFQRKVGSRQPRKTLQDWHTDTVLDKTLLAIFEEGTNHKTRNFG